MADPTAPPPDSPSLPNKALGRPLILYLAVIFAMILFQVAMVAFSLDARLATILMQVIVILGLALVYRQYFSHPDTTWPGLKKLGMSPLTLGLVMFSSVALGFLGMLLNALTLEIFPALQPLAETYQEGMEDLLLPDSLGLQVLGAIGVAVAAPICEEVLFRGTILAEQRRSQLAVGAIILNGALFAAIHFNPVGFVALAAVGTFWAHVTLRSRALWGAIAGHAALNLVNGVILLRLLVNYTGPQEDEVSLVVIIAALALVLPLAAALWWLTIRAIDATHCADSP